jgi:hypothetical protein
MSREIRQAETRLARRWLAQHQRLIGALGKQTQRSPMIVGRDFHSSAAGKTTRVGDVSLTSNPVSIPLGLFGTALAAALALTM